MVILLGTMSGRKTLLLLLIVVIISLAGARRGGGCDRKDQEKDHKCCDLYNTTRIINVTHIHMCHESEGHDDDDDSSDESDEDDIPGIELCVTILQFNVTITLCRIRCCEGWVADENGRCVVPAPGEVECENGGTPDSYSASCICPPDFIGIQCETPVCSPHCANGGECMADNGVAKCVCPEGFTGDQCQDPVCIHGCHNGGTCVSRGYYAECECAYGYTGRSCEHVERNGTCPSIMDMGQPSQEQKTCTYDDQCQHDTKCCPSEYGSFCVKPGNPTCTYKGKQYKQGEQINKSACDVCTCVHPTVYNDEEKGFECFHRDCPLLTCKVVKYEKGSCCPVCNGTSSPEPKISDCPTQKVTVKVDENQNLISVAEALKDTIHAHDHQYNKLEVSYSHSYLRACMCNYTEMNYHHITAVSEPDAYGRQAVCSFTVHVRDTHAPYFTGCSSAISVFTDEKISWLKPVAHDNVGVKRMELKTPYSNNSVFPEGRHFVEYHAEDYQKNIAICRIAVTVYNKETTDPSLPISMRHTVSTKKGLYIGIGAGAAALFVALLLFFIYYRSVQGARQRSQTPAPQAKGKAFDNTLYSVDACPPPYDNVVLKDEKDGAMTQTPDSPPPSYRAPSCTHYDSIDVQALARTMTNQLYMDQPPKTPPPSYKTSSEGSSIANGVTNQTYVEDDYHTLSDKI